MSLLDSEEILNNNADTAVLIKHANYRGIAQRLPSFDECEIGDIFWVRDDSNFYIREFENWCVLAPFDMILDDALSYPIAKYSLTDQEPENGLVDLGPKNYRVDISTIKINYSNEIV